MFVQSSQCVSTRDAWCVPRGVSRVFFVVSWSGETRADAGTNSRGASRIRSQTGTRRRHFYYYAHCKSQDPDAVRGPYPAPGNAPGDPKASLDRAHSHSDQGHPSDDGGPRPHRSGPDRLREDLRVFAVERGITAVALFGGQPIERQFTALRRRPHIAVATPGRLLDHLQRRTVTLEAVTVVILDEADRMLDMGFLPDVSRILKQTPAARQTALFSATMPPAIRALAEQWLRRPVWVRIDAPMPTVETVEQYYLEVMEEDKVRALRRLLVKETIPSALVFRRTKHRVDRLARALGRDRTVGVLHGGMRQEARLQALRAFEERRTPLLITTNVASRGLDLPEVSHVINFDMPEDVDTYIHRVGRTARAGRSGTAITFVGQHDIDMFDQLQKRLGRALQRHSLNIYS